MAVVDYKLLADVVSGSSDLRFLETMPGGYVGQSIIFPGNLWEETHARSGEALNHGILLYMRRLCLGW